ncbi:GtrA family protein [Plantibacter flavus]|uniref:GtrA family protein n=1 Tax=Plantibacter flavus TaxID=150123 RepID=UPI003F177F64
MTVKTEPSVVPSTQHVTHGRSASTGTLRRPAREPRRVPRLVSQLAAFGLVGGTAFVVDVGVYNLLRLTLLDDKPIGAKVISVAVATIVAWLGNRALTFRAERGRALWKEGALFALMNVGGLGIAAACLFVSHYILGYTSPLADNIAGNGVGLVLGMVFRFLAYRFLVFHPPQQHAASPESTGRTIPSDPGVPTPVPASAHAAAAQTTAPAHILSTSGGLS